MQNTQTYIDQLSFRLIGCAIEVHRNLGPGLLESVYEKCFTRELQLKGIHYQSQQGVPLEYKDIYLDVDLRYDVLVENLIIVELKSIAGILPIHESILLSYMKMIQKPKGVIINFNSTNIFKHGQKT
jgi:GxxExxY protein